MFFGITGNLSKYTQGEFGGITQELGQYDGQTSQNAGKNKITVRFCKNGQNYFIKLIAKVGTMFFGITSNPSMYTQGEFGGVTQELGQHDGQTSPNGCENQILMSFARISKTIL
jgi:hypothetical protein